MKINKSPRSDPEGPPGAIRRCESEEAGRAGKNVKKRSLIPFSCRKSRQNPEM